MTNSLLCIEYKRICTDLYGKYEFKLIMRAHDAFNKIFSETAFMPFMSFMSCDFFIIDSPFFERFSTKKNYVPFAAVMMISWCDIFVKFAKKVTELRQCVSDFEIPTGGWKVI